MDNPEGNNGPSSTNDSALFNLQGIINLEQFSLLFAQLLEQVESQNQKITKLETQVAQCLRINDFFAEVQKIDTYLNKLDKITQQLEIQSTSTIPGPDGELKKFAAGEVAQANFYQIQSLEKQLKLYTTHDEYEEQMKKIEQLFLNGRKYEYNINQLHEFITLLQKQMIEQNDTLSIHESLINNKLDKSEFSNLQSLMKIILIYEEFKNNTIKQLNDLEENHLQHHQKLVLQEEEFKKCEKRVYTIEEQIPKFALKKDIHILAKELKVHSERLDECTLITQTEKLIEQIYTINEALRNTQIFINDLSNDVNTIQDILPTKATLLNLIYVY